MPLSKLINSRWYRINCAFVKKSTSLKPLTDAGHGFYGFVPEARQIERDAENKDADDGRLSERHPDDLSGP